MRIGMLCSNYLPHPGGLEVMVQNLVRGLGRRNEVTLITSAYADATGSNDEDGVTVIRIPALHATERLGIPYPIPYGRSRASALRSLSSFDVLHAHGALYVSSIFAARVSRRWTIPLVLTEHVGFVRYDNAVVNAVQSAAWAAIGDRIVSRCSAVVTYNSRVQTWLSGRFPETRVEFIGNGVDSARFSQTTAAEREVFRQSFGLPLQRPLVLFAARDSQKKNLDAVLEFPRDSFHLVVCGARRDLRLDGVTDLGVVPYSAMPRLFGCVDVMVHASTGEGFPLAVQEALASGVPTALLWDSGYTQWLDRSIVAGCDTLSELGQVVSQLAQDPAARSRLSASGLRWAQDRWSWDATVRDYERLYDETRR